jgi:hypothetical protein
MGLFTKKVNEDRAKQYFVDAFKSVISEAEIKTHEQKLARLKAEFPAMANVRQPDFDKHLTAVNLTLLRQTWPMFVLMRLGTGSLIDNKPDELTGEVWASIPDLREYDNLYKDYNAASAYNSDPYAYTSGMAKMFILDVLPERDKDNFNNLDELYDTFASLFHDIVKTNLQHIKQSRLIS